MTALQVFDFKDQPMRVVSVEGEPWFVAVDLCRVLDLENSSDALKSLDEDERSHASAQTGGGEQRMAIVSESGLYALIFKSRKENARAFRKWVTSEVLPMLRKTGQYEMPDIAREGDEVRRIVLDALRGLWAGSVAPTKASAIFTGAKVYASLKAVSEYDSSSPEEVVDEEGAFGRMVDWLSENGAGREYTGEELREVAKSLGLFSWLDGNTWQTPSACIRFGILCDRMLERNFDGWALARRGSKNWRRFYVVNLAAIGEATGQQEE